MTFPPIVERELRVNARLASTYFNRMLTPAIVAVLAFIRVWLTPWPISRSKVGPTLFHTLSLLMLAFCILEGVRKTADSVSVEKREGTLGLLFLTDLQGYDVVLGKLAAAALTSLCALFAILPILGFSIILFGGVTLGELWRAGIASAVVLIFSLAVGIWVSSRSQSASRAMTATFLVVLLILLAPSPGQSFFFTPLSPARAFFCSPDLAYRAHAIQYWASLFVAAGFIWYFLSSASRRVNRFREEALAVSGDDRRSAKFGSKSAKSRPAKIREKLLTINPMLWLASRGHGSSKVAWLLAFITGAGISVVGYVTAAPRWTKTVNAASTATFFGPTGAEIAFIIFVAFINPLMNVLIASQACRCLAEARRNTTLEVLLCTPLRILEILEGQVLGLKRLFLLPS